MITFLLIIIAILLFVLASKIAPEGLNSIWIICVIAGIICLLFEYWAYIIAIPVVGVYAFQEFTKTEYFAWFAYIFDGALVGFFVYFLIQNLNRDLRDKDKRKEIAKDTKAIFKLVGKFFLYSILAIIALTVVVLIFIFLAQLKG